MLGLVIKREFTTLLGSKAMRISTAVLVALFLVAGVVGRYLLDDDGEASGPNTDAVTVGVTSSAADLIPFLSEEGSPILSEDIGDQDPKAAYNDDTSSYEAVISGEPGAPVISRSGEDSGIQNLVVIAAAKYAADQEGALTPELSAALTSLLAIHQVTASDDAITENPVGYGVGMVAIMILMFITIMGISVLSAGVVEENPAEWWRFCSPPCVREPCCWARFWALVRECSSSSWCTWREFWAGSGLRDCWKTSAMCSMPLGCSVSGATSRWCSSGSLWDLHVCGHHGRAGGRRVPARGSGGHPDPRHLLAARSTVRCHVSGAVSARGHHHQGALLHPRTLALSHADEGGH